METRNPSPPGETGQDCESADNIGETSYSKRWLYSLTLKVLQILQSEPGEFGAELERELDAELEDELCCLWDITANKEVLPHIHEFQLVPVFVGSLTKSRCPRLTEISLGILANLALDEEECTKITDDPCFMTNMFDIISSTDTRLLIECFRLFQVLLSSHNHRQVWLDAIHFSPEFFDRVNFILCSSTNSCLLVNTISVIETVVRIDDNISEFWCNERLLSSILEAQKQMQWLHGDEVEVIHRLFYIFSSNTSGVKALMANYHLIYPGFGVYLRKVCEDEPHLIPFERYHNSLRAIIPVIDVIISNLPLMSSLTTFDCDSDILPCLLKVTWGCVQSETTSSTFSLDGLFDDLTILFGDLMMRVQDLLQEKIGLVPDAVSAAIPASVSRTLRWLLYVNKSTTPQGLREAFVACCLRGRSEVRGYLIFTCHCLHLEALLECVTDDG